jgi:hypothetical protein
MAAIPVNNSRVLVYYLVCTIRRYHEVMKDIAVTCRSSRLHIVDKTAEAGGWFVD